MQREGKSIGSGKKTARQTGADILKTRWGNSRREGRRGVGEEEKESYRQNS